MKAAHPTHSLAELLGQHPIIGRAPAEALKVLAAACRFKRFAVESTLVTTGTPQTEIFVITRGQVALSRRNKEAKTQMLSGVVESPGLLGDAEYYAGNQRWLVTVRTSRQTDIVFVPNAAFDAFVRQHREVAYALYRDASSRHFLAVAINQVNSLQKTSHRILRLLAGKHSDSAAPIDLSIVALANALGLNRRTVVRNLTLLEEQGWLIREGKHVFLRISDPRAFTIDDLRGGLGAKWALPAGEGEG